MNKKILSLQALRTLAFVGIFISHTQTVKWNLGAWGVSVFLVLSGFLMATAYYEKKLDADFLSSALFSWKKMLALYPLHIITMIVGLFLAKNSARITSVNIITNIFLIQSWMPRRELYFSLNMVAWYLSVCLFVYFIFPAVLKRLQAAKNVGQLLVGAIIVLLLQGTAAYVSYRFRTWEISDNFYKWVTYILPLSRAGDFLVGSILGCIFIKRNREANTNGFAATILEMAAFGASVFSLRYHATQFNISWTSFALWYLPPAVLLVYSFAMNKGVFARLLTNKVTVWLGDISSYGFLFHQVIIRSLRIIIPRFIEADLSKVTHAIIAFVLTVIASAIYKKYFADPLTKPLYAAHARLSDRLLKKYIRKQSSECN